MTELYKITEEFATLISGKSCFKDNAFYPRQDINGEWFISKEEVSQCTNWRYMEVIKTLKLSEFVPQKIEIEK